MTIKVASTTATEADVQEASRVEVVTTTDDPFALTPPSAAPVASSPETPSEPDDAQTEETETTVETAASEPEESEDVPDIEASADEEEEADAVEATPEPAPVAPTRKRRRRGRSYKDRASQLAREKAAETQRANALDLELQRLRSLSAERPSPVPERSVPTPVNGDAPPTSSAAPSETDAEAKPLQENFETYDEFQEAIVDWKVSERLTHHEAQQRDRIERDRVQRAQEALVAAHTARIATFRSAHGDFDAIVTAGKDLPMTRPMQDAVLNSESGPAMMYHLCQNPEECDRIAAMNPILALKEMGRLEGRLEVAVPGPTSTAESITKAPRPIKPVGGGATASTIPLDQMAYREYKRIRDKEELADRGR